MASVIELPKGKSGARRWRLFIGSGPSRKSRVVYADGKKHALLLLDEWRAEMGETVTLKRYSRTVAEEVDGWLEDRTTLSTGTRRNYRIALEEARKHPTFSVPLVRVTPAELKKLIDAVAATSPDYARRVRTVLNQAFNVAVVEGKILANPIAAVRAPAAKATEIDAPPPDIVMACIAEARKDADRTIAMAIHLAAATGARRAELCGLRWEDLRGTTLHIERAVNVLEGGGYEVVRPKTTMSRRSIALDRPVLAALEAHKAWQTSWRAEHLHAGPSEWILGDVMGHGPRLPDRLTHEWMRVRNALPGAKSVRLHDLRHWNATSMLDAGIPIPTVAGRLGHASGATTIRVYSHRTRRADEASAEVIGNLFSGEPSALPTPR